MFVETRRHPFVDITSELGRIIYKAVLAWDTARLGAPRVGRVKNVRALLD
jgi:hypothetical protein